MQYDILDPRAYLVRTADVSLAIENLATAELSAAIAARDVDDILTLGRLEIQQQVLAAVKKRLDEWSDEGRGLGVQIKSVTLESVRPPQEVDAAFRDVTAAREDQQRAINEAQGYLAALIPMRRGEAERIRLEGEGSAAETVERAAEERPTASPKWWPNSAPGGTNGPAADPGNAGRVTAEAEEDSLGRQGPKTS